MPMASETMKHSDVAEQKQNLRELWVLTALLADLFGREEDVPAIDVPAATGDEGSWEEDEGLVPAFCVEYQTE